MFDPVSTYRIQFHKGFTFNDLEGIIPYLQKLGISTLYASPIFRSVPGSMHGYDGVAPTHIDPEIGTLEQLRKLSKKLRSKGISWLQDIVPNHMAFHPDNTWLMDVLEKGPASPYTNFFDHDEKSGPIMVPFLGSSLDEVISKNELKVEWQNQRLAFNYLGNKWPLNPASQELIKSILKDEQSLDKINRDHALLKQLAAQQYYRLCYWQETDHNINYRRFFTVNGLICLNMQRQEVFDAFHSLVGTLVKEGIFQGLRVDHIDGLYDPTTYLQRLRELAGPDTYIIVEKILEPGEKMPEWPVKGNTGYDFLALVNNLLTGDQGEKQLAKFYRQLTGDQTPVSQKIADKKRAILTRHMAGELADLTQLFWRSGLVDEDTLSRTSFHLLQQAIGEFLVACPVYRFYGNSFPLDTQETDAVQSILKGIHKQWEDLAPAIGLLEEVLLKQKPDDVTTASALHFYQRCMQFTGPLMAKGVEDTLMYTDNHFIAHNEVGDSPNASGMSVKAFHQAMIARQRHWPLSINATATHDTKRGEDVRARLQVLPDLADEWIQQVDQWRELNKALKQYDQPGINDEYFIYQTLVGAYPMPGDTDTRFKQRITQYLEKALREGKEHSDWAQPNEAYETATKDFAKALLDKRRPFWKSFAKFHRQVSDQGIVNSLVQVLLKFSCPGVPDTYQGCEHWDLSLVDPDNRRPVDHAHRRKLLRRADPVALWQKRADGQIKVWLTHMLATERQLNPDVFTKGEYLPLNVMGQYRDHVMVFVRKHHHTAYLVVVPIGMAALCKAQGADITGVNFADTRIDLADIDCETAQNLCKTSEKKREILRMLQQKNSQNIILVSDLLAGLPFAVWKLELAECSRSAGVLLAISSLPSAFGVGDIGPAAHTFADKLKACGQTYWQLLPVGPAVADVQYSPYSSYSSFAGNPLFISPELLVDDDLLNKSDIDKYKVKSTGKVNYAYAEKVRQELFDKAWYNYKDGRGTHLSGSFTAFCTDEQYWLDDHALYIVLKSYHRGLTWYAWPGEYKFRDKAALAQFIALHTDELQQAKWLQFLFDRQWRQLKTHCSTLGIKLFGDLPFYASYDSVDVWANRELFSLSRNGEMKLIAGVPPDYFNANGQLWNMPVFNWKRLKATGYEWWLQRIRKNLQYFDQLRLDHFRAFSSYWAVPAGETTAVNGSWHTAPGADLLMKLKRSLPDMPLIAEDLGDIDDAVIDLRDRFGLAGMKVLQFAFGKDMAASPHIPHQHNENFVVYTGTHDNNTTKGWYRQDVDKCVKKHIRQYTSSKVNSKDIDREMIKMALASVARTAIIPIQDWLELDEKARMNTPAGTGSNWTWRLTARDLQQLPAKRIIKWMKRYGRM